MNLKQIIAPALLISSLTLTRAAETAEPPSVDSILAKCIAASGGKTAMEKINSRSITFKLESDTISGGEGEVFATVPNKQRSHIDLGTTGVIDEGFDGKVAWAKTPWEPLRLKTGDELAKVKRDAEFHRELKLKSLYPGLAYKLTEKVGEAEAYLLESKPSPTSKEKFWFDAKGGLLVRQESEFEGPQGVVNVNMLLQDYKAFDGLKYPGVIKLNVSAGGQTYELTMRISQIKHDPQIAPEKFSKPSE